VDVGWLGVPLPAGEHNLELRYRNPFLIPALGITFLSLVITVVAMSRWFGFIFTAEERLVGL
jgi:uncharacterized membrane protein YfhO